MDYSGEVRLGFLKVENQLTPNVKAIGLTDDIFLGAIPYSLAYQ
jgi:hypothetical protein